MLQSCPTLCDPIGSSPSGSPIPGILQARILEWVAISVSNAWKWKVKVKLLSRVRLFVTPWTAAHQAPPPMGFYRQEYRSRVPLPSLEALLSRWQRRIFLPFLLKRQKWEPHWTVSLLLSLHLNCWNFPYPPPSNIIFNHNFNCQLSFSRVLRFHP